MNSTIAFKTILAFLALVPLPTLSISRKSLGFNTSNPNHLYLGDVGFVANTDQEEYKKALSALDEMTRTENSTVDDNETYLVLMINVLADLQHLSSHMQFMRPFILSKHSIMLFTSDFSNHGVRTVFLRNFNSWPNLKKLHVQVDSTNFAHCLGILRFFPQIQIKQCTIYIDSIKNSLERTPFDERRIREMGDRLFPHASELDLVLSYEPVRDTQLFSANLKWFKVLMEKMKVEWLRLCFNAAISMTELDLFVKKLGPVWKFDLELSDKPALKTDLPSIDFHEQEYLFVFHSDTSDCLYSRNEWIKATEFWLEHAQNHPS